MIPPEWDYKRVKCEDCSTEFAAMTNQVRCAPCQVLYRRAYYRHRSRVRRAALKVAG